MAERPKPAEWAEIGRGPVEERNRREPRRDRAREAFSDFSSRVSALAGSAWTFALALGVVLAWAVTGPLFGFSDTWQLVINTGTTIVTFLMVFVIQHAQNKDTAAIHIKLNELIAAVKGASNRLIDLEDFTDRETRELQKAFRRLADETAEDTEATSVEHVLRGR